MSDKEPVYKVPEKIIVIDSKRWVVLRTKARAEKKLSEYCTIHQIENFLPLRKSIKRYEKRTAEFYIPMFTGYLFAQICVEDEPTLNRSSHLATIIRPDKLAEETLVSELNDVKRLIEATLDGEIVVRPEIEVGKTIFIKSGPLAGLNGIVQRWKNKSRISVNVDMIGQSVMMEVEASEVELDF